MKVEQQNWHGHLWYKKKWGRKELHIKRMTHKIGTVRYVQWLRTKTSQTCRMHQDICRGAAATWQQCCSSVTLVIFVVIRAQESPEQAESNLGTQMSHFPVTISFYYQTADYVGLTFTSKCLVSSQWLTRCRDSVAHYMVWRLLYRWLLHIIAFKLLTKAPYWLLSHIPYYWSEVPAILKTKTATGNKHKEKKYHWKNSCYNCHPVNQWPPHNRAKSI